jgi:hypothetical protein
MPHQETVADRPEDRAPRDAPLSLDVEDNTFLKNTVVDPKRTATGKRPPRDFVGEPEVKDPNFVLNGKKYRFADTSLFLFTPQDVVRLRCVQIFTSDNFRWFILSAIVLNSIVLSLTDWSVVDKDTYKPFLVPASSGYDVTRGIYNQVPAESGLNSFCTSAEYFFLVVFNVEAIIKIIGMGFVLGEGTYLRDGWNILDFIVVVSGNFSLIPGIPTVSVIRTVRVLRPLRSLAQFPRMRTIVKALIGSVKPLANVAFLLTFVFTIFGILGLQMWSGTQHYRCRLTPEPVQLLDGWTAGEYIDSVYRGETKHGMSPADMMSALTAIGAGGGLARPCVGRSIANEGDWDEPAPLCVWPVSARSQRADSAPQAARAGPTTTAGANRASTWKRT